jgi:hypothetical protein
MSDQELVNTVGPLVWPHSWGEVSKSGTVAESIVACADYLFHTGGMTREEWVMMLRMENAFGS